MKICTLGSHTALQIMKGAKDEGMETILICTKDRKSFYDRFPIVDEYIIVDSYKDLLNDEVQDKLIAENAVLIPHGSLVEYVGAQNSLNLKVLASKYFPT